MSEVDSLGGVTCGRDHKYRPIWMVRLGDVPCWLLNVGSPLAGRAEGQAVSTRRIVPGAPTAHKAQTFPRARPS